MVALRRAFVRCGVAASSDDAAPSGGRYQQRSCRNYACSPFHPSGAKDDERAGRGRREGRPRPCARSRRHAAATHLHLTGGGFDLPQVRPVFDRYVADHGLADRVRFLAGDFFRDPLPAADVLVMGRILHDWDLGRKRALLAKAHAGLPEGGALVVSDTIIDDERRTNATGLLMSLNMLIETRGGFGYTGADCTGWMREAGFREARVEPLAATHSMVVGTK